MSRLWGGLCCKVPIILEAKSLQEGLRDLLRQVQLRAAGHFRQLRCLPLLCQFDYQRQQAQMPLSYYNLVFIRRIHPHIFICLLSE